MTTPHYEGANQQEDGMKETLAFLGVDPAALEPAPERPTRADSWPRIDIHSPSRRRCSSCRALAAATRVVRPAGDGPRWLDQCRDCMIAGIRLTWEAGAPAGGRYKVTLAVDGRPTMEGWWEERATADRKYLGWIGEYSNRASARVTLTDATTGDELTKWPREQRSGAARPSP
ncbi:hypothetical protein ACFU6S_06275 [Streptomyces sp. NPDC057456]|uniref:hypothetical protein n=1 Tax=Streptomyces sp. NPDC057456 TaxID=3346139 RepID=UPI00368A99BE